MFVYSCALIHLLFHLTKSEDCVIDNRSPETSWEQQLRKDLISCADQNKPPDSNNTVVTIRFLLKSFKFDDKEEIFSINSWLYLVWNDPRLKWNTKEYDSIESIVLSSAYIWNPSLKHHTAHGYDDLDYFVSTCKVTNTGHVTCILRILLETVCSSKLSDWPYDTQNCTLKFGSQSIDNVTFTYNSSRAVTMFGAEYGPGWDIIDYSNGKIPNGDVQFYFSFVLERQGVCLAAIIIAPSLVLSTLTVLSMSLNVEDKVRLSIQCFSSMCQFFFLQEISYDIPKHSADSPTILIYSRTSIVLTLMAIGITFLLHHLHRRNAPAPNYIVELCDRLLEPYGKYIIWPRWKTGKENQNEEVAFKISSVWIDFASIVNFVSMLVIAITYVIIFSVYIPQQLPQY